MRTTLVLGITTVFLMSLVGCSSSDEAKKSPRAECEFGQRYDPIRDRCVTALAPPSPNNMTDPQPTDAGPGAEDQGSSSTDMGNAEPDMRVQEPCEVNERRCLGNELQVCVGGFFETDQVCEAGFMCERGNCVPEDANSCQQGARRCVGETVYQVCEADQTWGESQLCEADESCSAGQCTKSCAGLVDGKSNVGCEYITMRHNQLSGLRTLPHTVVVSNPGNDQVTVEVTSPAGLNSGIPSQTIAPLDSAVLDFPTSPMINSAGVSSNYYVIRSSLPVIATQFAPLNNPGLGSETSDASLLLPTNAIGQEYVVVGWRALQPGGSYIDVVSIEDGTTVTVESSTPLSGGSAGSVSANGSATFNLSANQVLHLAENRGFFSTGNRDVSGAVITANKPVAVYTGGTLVNIPDEPLAGASSPGCASIGDGCTLNGDCCSGMCGYSRMISGFECKDSFAAGDHVEQQLFPVESWGSSYVVTPFTSRGPNDFTIYRVVSATDSTVVNLDPPVDGVSSFTLDRGEVHQLMSTEPFEVDASEDVMVAQFMIGGDSSSSGDGDPAFLLPPAIEQYREDYVFLVPGNYDANRVTFVRKTGVQVLLDSTPVADSEFQSVGTSGVWEYAVIDSISAGVHRAESAEAFGIVVHGVDEYISYAFSGGVTLPE